MLAAFFHVVGAVGELDGLLNDILDADYLVFKDLYLLVHKARCAFVLLFYVAQNENQGVFDLNQVRVQRIPICERYGQLSLQACILGESDIPVSLDLFVLKKRNLRLLLLLLHLQQVPVLLRQLV